MNERENLVQAVLQAADCVIVGRIRLQKIFYLLEQLGLKSSLRFAYHHYGPYSEELSDTLEWGQIMGDISEDNVPTEGGYYSIYKLNANSTPERETLGDLPWPKVKILVKTMKAETSPVLEIAATIHWLKNKERIEDWRKELKVRKASKATDIRITKAYRLLNKLELAP